MTAGGFCEKHGPYDAGLSQCPYCAQERGLPPAPPSLDDDLVTDPWGGQGHPAHAAYDEEETDFGFRSRLHEEDEEVTQWPERRSAALAGDETVVERASDEGMLGFLVVKEGMRRGQVHRIHHGATVGRDQAKIIVRDPKVSRLHAKFTIEDDQFVVWDFGSENGTFVNGEQIREATPLKENDVIRMGDTVFVLKTLQ